MSDYSPITPPPELVAQWYGGPAANNAYERHIATQAARWGADQELEASLAWLVQEAYIDAPCRLRAARRPKKLSLKERALEALPTPAGQVTADHLYTIRLALEQLND